ncbi:hypothetical protein CYMTET_41499 [Cymbomonas tetramitiformis]|uniref:Uncharacterized protein n=1 Tax=Cymbomonas tetramitiformis TaxID=36881 RepID=A0AAE0F2K7_9CHLO|nr:hypothetical protein CYMTET_41499 [Cymbomonas tetramitiformis]
MVHFGSATPAVIDQPAVEHEPRVAIERDDDSALYPQQFIDGEPPFEQSFMDNMSVQLGFNELVQQVSANYFTPLPPWISSTHESAGGVADSESESVSDDADVRGDVPPPALRVGGVKKPTIGTCLTAAAMPALFICLSMCFTHTATASALCGV